MELASSFPSLYLVKRQRGSSGVPSLSRRRYIVPSRRYSRGALGATSSEHPRYLDRGLYRQQQISDITTPTIYKDLSGRGQRTFYGFSQIDSPVGPLLLGGSGVQLLIYAELRRRLESYQRIPTLSQRYDLLYITLATRLLYSALRGDLASPRPIRLRCRAVSSLPS